MAEKVEDLAAQVYEAKQETRTDINQDRIKDLKDEFKSLEAESRKAESWSERAPILDRQKEIQGEIYEQRHGQRTELGDQSAKHRLGHEEHKLHEAHRAISEFGKQHPETGIESPATRAGVQGMNQAQLKDLSKNLQQAASHLQTASRSMDRMKDGNVGAELRGQLKSAAEQAIAKAAPALAAASKAVEAAQHRGLSMGR